MGGQVAASSSHSNYSFAFLLSPPSRLSLISPSPSLSSLPSVSHFFFAIPSFLLSITRLSSPCLSFSFHPLLLILPFILSSIPHPRLFRPKRRINKPFQDGHTHTHTLVLLKVHVLRDHIDQNLYLHCFQVLNKTLP